MNNYSIENSDNSLTQLLERVKADAERQVDFTAPTTDLQLQTEDNKSTVVIEANRGLPTMLLETNDVAFDQIAQRIDVPAKHARRLRENYPAELDGLVRAIWDKEPERRMVRTYMDSDLERSQRFGVPANGIARAFVSDKFKTFDNKHLLEAALPQLIESPAQWQVVSGNVTDKRLYLQLKSQVIVGQPAVGDLMAHGIRFSNSEVGHGSISVEQLAFTLWCLNGCTAGKSFRKAHLGRAMSDADDFAKILKQDTIAAQNEALRLTLRDLIGEYASRESFDEAIDKFGNAHQKTIDPSVSPQVVVERLGGVLKLSQMETSNVLDGLMKTIQQQGYAGKKISQATLVNAVTAVQHVVEPDDAGYWQKTGAKVLDLPANQWEIIKEAA